MKERCNVNELDFRWSSLANHLRASNHLHKLVTEEQTTLLSFFLLEMTRTHICLQWTSCRKERWKESPVNVEYMALLYLKSIIQIISKVIFLKLVWKKVWGWFSSIFLTMKSGIFFEGDRWKLETFAQFKRKFYLGKLSDLLLYNRHQMLSLESVRHYRGYHKTKRDKYPLTHGKNFFQLRLYYFFRQL